MAFYGHIESKRMDCKTIQEKLEAHILEALSEEESKEIEKHLENCSSCQKFLAEAIQALDVLQSMPGIEPEGGYADKIFIMRARHRKMFRLMIWTTFFMLLMMASLLFALFYYQRKYRPATHFNSLQNAIWKYYRIEGIFPGSAFLGKKDIRDPRSLVIKLQEGEDPLSKYIYEKLTAKTLVLVEDFEDKKTISTKLCIALRENLNLLLQKRSFYNQKRFRHVLITKKMQIKISKLKTKDLESVVFINRELLCAAYPKEIKPGRFRCKNRRKLKILIEKKYLSPKMYKTNKNGEILDIWGTPYHYKYFGTHNPLTFDLQSYGKNRKDEKGKGDDLKNW